MHKRVFSAIQPSGILHLGNYAGSIRNWLTLQETHSCIFSIVDLHSITLPQNPIELRKNVLTTTALYLACGIDPEKNILFQQSLVKEHAQLAWILSTLTKISELKLMHQFKEKTKDKTQNINAGLFMYPVLMAADILLYKPVVVPVGEDQQQHIELCRELARRFNSQFGEIFIVPEGFIPTVGARVMGLDDPKKKMSKSASTPLNYIALTDTSEDIAKKIQRAVTDSGSEIVMQRSKPAVSNLLELYTLFSGMAVKDIEQTYEGKGYKDFKRDLAEVIIAFLKPIQKKYSEYLADEGYLEEVLQKGALRAKKIAKTTLQEVHERMGLGV